MQVGGRLQDARTKNLIPAGKKAVCTTSISRVEFLFQGLHIAQRNRAPVYFEQPLGLQAGEVARDQLPHGSDLCRQFLVAHRKHDLYTLQRALSLLC